MTEQVEKVALEPCPFCGAKDERLIQAFTRATDDFAYWSVECLDCACEIASDDSQDEANTAWNTRTPPDDSVARIVAWLRLFRLDSQGEIWADWFANRIESGDWK